MIETNKIACISLVHPIEVLLQRPRKAFTLLQEAFKIFCNILCGLILHKNNISVIIKANNCLYFSGASQENTCVNFRSTHTNFSMLTPALQQRFKYFAIFLGIPHEQIICRAWNVPQLPVFLWCTPREVGLLVQILEAPIKTVAC